MDALKQNSRIDVTYFPSDNEFDTNVLKNKFDIILLYENWNNNLPDKLIGIDKIGIPVIARCGDFHATIKYDIIGYHEKYNIDYYFGFNHQDYFYQFYPKKFKYKTIIFSLEKSLYEKTNLFKNRIKNKVLLSGAISHNNITKKLKWKLKKPRHGDSIFEYKLRTSCSYLSYIDYTSTLNHDYVGDKYPLIITKISNCYCSYISKPYNQILGNSCCRMHDIYGNN